MRFLITLLFLFIIVDLYGQNEKVDGCFILDKNNNKIKVDNLSWIETNEFPIAIKVSFKNGLEKVLTPHDINGIEVHTSGLSYVFESVFDLRNEEYDFTKTGIFLTRKCSGKIDLFTMNTKDGIFFCAKYKNKWTLFNSSNDQKRYLDFFTDKKMVYSNVRNLIRVENWDSNSMIDIVNYFNEPPEEFFGIEHYSDLDSLCYDFINIIKTDNEKEIEKFCQKIFINKHYNDYFKKYNFGYRGLPFSTDEELNSYVLQDTKVMINIKNMWKKNCNLDSIELVDIYKGMIDTIDYRYNIKFSGLGMKIKTNTEEIWGLGEIINVEGKWIILFDPR